MIIRIFVILLFLQACGPDAPKRTEAAFFCWETTFRLDATEQHYLDSLRCRKLYVKFLDIGRAPDNSDIRPYALLELADTAGLAGKTIVPCVFLTNSVFQSLPGEKQDWLAQKTAQALRSVGAQFPDTVFREVQFDCDWTAATRDAYFSFLKKMRRQLPAQTRLSATIRLHQFKFPKQTGVPPADRGMLMFYNTGDIDDWLTNNSIFEAADARKYVSGAPRPYPLPLDVALPVFSWALVFREAEFWKILPHPGDFEPAIFEPVPPEGSGRYRVLKGTFRSGHYLRPGDQIRVERMLPQQLREAAAQAAAVELAPGGTVAFFQLDSAVVRLFPPAVLQSVCRQF